MAEGSYKQSCPVAMASEILCTRWTIVLPRELVAGSTRFNDLRRGVPRMSPALLSKRLKDLEGAGILERRLARGGDVSEYHLTPAGKELHSVVEAVGIWGQRWITSNVSLDNLDVGLLMWDMRRGLKPEPMPPPRSTIMVTYSDLPAARAKWWLIVEPQKEVDLCSVDPGFDVDLFVNTDLRTMTEIWMGHQSVRAARDSGRLRLIGSRSLEDNMQAWLGLSPFAPVERRVA